MSFSPRRSFRLATQKTIEIPLFTKPVYETTSSVYVAYTNFAISPRQIEVTRSTAGGQTWSAPVVLASGNVQGPIPRVGPSGEVHVAWENWPDTPRAIKIRTAATWPNFGAETLVSNVVPIALPRFMD